MPPLLRRHDEWLAGERRGLHGAGAHGRGAVPRRAHPGGAPPLAPQHTFQVLTKRPERMRAYLEQVSDERDMQRWARWADIAKSPCAAGIFDELDWPIANAHLGVS